MDWLRANSLIEETEEPQTGGLVLYFDEQSWQHIGVVQPRDRVRSKWGRHSVYDHSLTEVTVEYGDNLRFYECPPPSMARQLYFKFGCDALELKEEEIQRLRSIVGC